MLLPLRHLSSLQRVELNDDFRRSKRIAKGVIQFLRQVEIFLWQRKPAKWHNVLAYFCCQPDTAQGVSAAVLVGPDHSGLWHICEELLLVIDVGNPSPRQQRRHWRVS